MVADGRNKSHSWHSQLAYTGKAHIFFEVFARWLRLVGVVELHADCRGLTNAGWKVTRRSGGSNAPCCDVFVYAPRLPEM